jgi:hypothetical protein
MKNLTGVPDEPDRALGKDVRQFRAQEAGTLSYRDPALQQEGTNLVDDAGALADQPLTHPMQRLQVELRRYRCPSWQRSNWIGWTWQCSFKVPSQRHSPVR